MKVHGWQAYGKMDVTGERISRISELREVLLSIQTGFNLVNAAVVCTILESISGSEPSSVITDEGSTQTDKTNSLKNPLPWLLCGADTRSPSFRWLDKMIGEYIRDNRHRENE